MTTAGSNTSGALYFSIWCRGTQEPPGSPQQKLLGRPAPAGRAGLHACDVFDKAVYHAITHAQIGPVRRVPPVDTHLSTQRAGGKKENKKHTHRHGPRRSPYTNRRSVAKLIMIPLTVVPRGSWCPANLLLAGAIGLMTPRI